MIAALAVVSGGFPQPRGYRDDAGREGSLVAAGALQPSTKAGKPNGKSIEPSDVAKALQPEQWQRMLPRVKATALGLMREGRLTITKKGKPIDPAQMKGVIRLRHPTPEEATAARAALPPVSEEDDG